MTATAELRMPLGYVTMDAEEMEYLEGGGTYTIYVAKSFMKKVLNYSTKKVADIMHARLRGVKYLNWNLIYAGLTMVFGSKINKNEVAAGKIRYTDSRLKKGSYTFK